MAFAWRRIARFIAFVGTLLIARKAIDPALDLLLPLGWFEPMAQKFGQLVAARGVAIVGVALVIGLAMLVWWGASRLLGLPSYDPPQ